VDLGRTQDFLVFSQFIEAFKYLRGNGNGISVPDQGKQITAIADLEMQSFFNLVDVLVQAATEVGQTLGVLRL